MNTNDRGHSRDMKTGKKRTHDDLRPEKSAPIPVPENARSLGLPAGIADAFYGSGAYDDAELEAEDEAAYGGEPQER